MFTYFDQNVLIDLAEQQADQRRVLNARENGEFIPVLSPWHFHEFGNASQDSQERLLQLTEKLNPQWIYDRADLQTYEFSREWQQLWHSRKINFKPVTDMAHVVAAIMRSDPRIAQGLTLRQFVEFSAEKPAQTMLRRITTQQMGIVRQNQQSFAEGRISNAFMQSVLRLHIAAKVLVIETGLSPTEDHYTAAKAALDNALFASKVDAFIYWQFAKRLRSYLVESALSLLFYKTTAVFNHNRLIDRQHAIIALPYLDVFVTRDSDLQKRCAAASATLPFPTAKVLTRQEFLNSLSTF